MQDIASFCNRMSKGKINVVLWFLSRRMHAYLLHSTLSMTCLFNIILVLQFEGGKWTLASD